MSAYDTITVPYPGCGTQYAAQSKGRKCTLTTFTLTDAPFEVMTDANRHAPFVCTNCHTVFDVDIEKRQTKIISMKSSKNTSDRLNSDDPCKLIGNNFSFNEYKKCLVELHMCGLTKDACFPRTIVVRDQMTRMWKLLNDQQKESLKKLSAYLSECDKNNLDWLKKSQIGLYKFNLTMSTPYIALGFVMIYCRKTPEFIPGI